MIADRLQAGEIIRVAGHLEEKRGIYQMALSWTGDDGNRNRKSISTRLSVKGNKKRAETMLQKTRQEYEELLMQAQQEEALAQQEMEEQPENQEEASKILFADFMKQWLDVIKPDIKLTTYGGYCVNVKSAIAPYFREKSICLQDLAASDINDFYADQLKRVKATSVLKYHANISKALKYAVEKDLILIRLWIKLKGRKRNALSENFSSNPRLLRFLKQ